MLRDRLEEIERRVCRAAEKSGRRREDVTILAVTKTFPAEVIVEAYEAGMRDFGENYVQEFEGKHTVLAGLPEARFHLIGHLQSNKARRAMELFHSIQTVDSGKLARRLEECGSPLDVMIEVKLSPEGSKHGASPEELPALCQSIRALPNLRLTGLMTIPPWSTDAASSRPYFAKLRELSERHAVPGLSMGMSNDFEVAIEEGATHVRIGTALFGSRKKP